MGVKGLSELIKKTAPNLIKYNKNLNNFKGLTFGIDSNLLTNKFHFIPISNYSFKKSNLSLKEFEEFNYLRNWYKFLNSLKENEIKAVLVFDGLTRLEEKSLEVKKRKQERLLVKKRSELEFKRFERLENLKSIWLNDDQVDGIDSIQDRIGIEQMFKYTVDFEALEALEALEKSKLEFESIRGIEQDVDSVSIPIDISIPTTTTISTLSPDSPSYSTSKIDSTNSSTLSENLPPSLPFTTLSPSSLSSSSPTFSVLDPAVTPSKTLINPSISLSISDAAILEQLLAMNDDFKLTALQDREFYSPKQIEIMKIEERFFNSIGSGSASISSNLKELDLNEMISDIDTVVDESSLLDSDAVSSLSENQVIAEQEVIQEVIQEELEPSLLVEKLLEKSSDIANSYHFRSIGVPTESHVNTFVRNSSLILLLYGRYTNFNFFLRLNPTFR